MKEHEPSSSRREVDIYLGDNSHRFISGEDVALNMLRISQLHERELREASSRCGPNLFPNIYGERRCHAVFIIYGESHVPASNDYPAFYFHAAIRYLGSDRFEMRATFSRSRYFPIFITSIDDWLSEIIFIAASLSSRCLHGAACYFARAVYVTRHLQDIF